MKLRSFPIPLGGDRVVSYYTATAHPAPARPPLAGQVRADVAVVGGGLTGLSAALELAQRGLSVVLLEGRRVGWGASGRNGGQMLNGVAAGQHKVETALGLDDARAVWDMTVEATELVRERIARYGIDCDWRPGYLHAAAKPSHMAHLAKEAEELTVRYGYRGLTVLGPEETGDHIDSPRFYGGVHDAGCGHLHPLNYALGLARAAEAAGAVIHEDSPVLALSEGASPVLRTPAGEVTCDHVVLAANVYVRSLRPDVGRTIMPVATFMIATEPLGANAAAALLPSDACVSDSNFVLDYFRRSADHRILFGGGVSYSGLNPPHMKALMRRHMVKTFPSLGGARIDHVWGGLVDITVNRLPDFGRIGPNIYYAQGFSGHGVALTGLAGRVVAEAVAGTAGRFDVFARIPHVHFPGLPGLRTPLLVLAMNWFRLRDLLS